MANNKKRSKGKNSNYRGTPSARKKAIKRFSKKWLASIITAAVIIAAVLLIIFLPKKDDTEKQKDIVPIDYQADIYADIEIKKYGTITVKLDHDCAPITVENFVSLAQSGFYDGLTFHRIMKNFMMQGGDPKGNGTGGSGTNIKGEFSSNGFDNPLSHTRGTVSMARSSNSYDSASSQFFICHQDSTFLDGDYAAFGYVTKGMDIVDKICTTAKPTDSNGSIPAAQQPVIKSITVYNG